MMSKGVNIFASLKRHDNDDEDHRPNKKELRTQEKSTVLALP